MKSFLLSVFVLIGLISWAQQTGTIQGSAKDLNTEEPLAFSKVFAEGTQFGAVTDIDGNFSFELPVGTYTIVITSIGYEPMKKFNVPVNS